MRGPGRWGGMLASIIVAGSMLCVPAGAQEPGCVGLEITPARLEADLRWSQEYQVVVRNCTDEPLRVITGVTALGHDLDGAPEFFESSSAEEALLVAGGGEFTLQPGAQRSLDATATIQRPDRSLYAGVVAEFERLEPQPGTSIETRSRVASMLLMRGPKPWKESVEVVDISVTPNGDGTYTVHAALENTGNVHVAPKGKMHIRKDGELLTTVQLTGGTILPGFKRRLVGTWTPPKDLNGRVELNADVTDPPATGTVFVDFDEGEAAVPSARITSIVASDADGAYIEVTLRNTGIAAITPTVELIVTERSFERARRFFPQTEPIQPGDERTVVWEPQLADGTYRITARAVQGEQLLDEKVTGLRIGAPQDATQGGGMPMWLIVLASLLLLAVLAALMFVMTRKRSRDEDGPPSAPHHPPRELTRTAAR